jgi:hypothetical protein
MANTLPLVFDPTYNLGRGWQSGDTITFPSLPILPNQSAALVYAGPATGSAAPGFRALAGTDLPWAAIMGRLSLGF